MNALVTDSKFVLLTLLDRVIRSITRTKQSSNKKLPEMQNQIVVHPADGKRNSDEVIILQQIRGENFVCWYFPRIGVDEAIAVLVMWPRGRNQRFIVDLVVVIVIDENVNC